MTGSVDSTISNFHVNVYGFPHSRVNLIPLTLVTSDIHLVSRNLKTRVRKLGFAIDAAYLILI